MRQTWRRWRRIAWVAWPGVTMAMMFVESGCLLCDSRGQRNYSRGRVHAWVREGYGRRRRVADVCLSVCLSSLCCVYFENAETWLQVQVHVCQQQMHVQDDGRFCCVVLLKNGKPGGWGRSRGRRVAVGICTYSIWDCILGPRSSVPRLWPVGTTRPLNAER